jgi:hypothetical protein
MLAPLIAVAAYCGAACSIGVSFDSASTSAVRPCNSTADCYEGMVCTAHQCLVSDLPIPNVLLDVSLPSSVNVGQYSGMGFVLLLDVPTQGKADIVLPALATLLLDADFSAIPGVGLGCDYTLGESGIKAEQVSVTHRWPVDGLETTVFTAKSLPASFAAVPSDSSYYYEAYYSITTNDPNCQLPPVLVRDVDVAGNRTLMLSWPQPKSIAISVQIQKSAGSDLDGWQLDIVDPVQGRSLANPATLGSSSDDSNDDTLKDYKATVSYNPIMSADLSPPAGTEVVRLQPPRNSAQPTYYASISGLTLFSSNSEIPLPIGAVPSVVSVSGRVETLDEAKPLSAPIAFVSTGFSVSNSGIWTEYSTTAQSDTSGQFQVTLPAGQYRVLVVPPGDGKHAVLDTQWTVQATPSNQAGRLLQVPACSQIQGTIDGTLQLAADASATIQATPSDAIHYDKASGVAAVRTMSLGARTASMLFQPQSADSRSFALPSDTGYFDVSLQPPEGLPWLVSPGRQVSAGNNSLGTWTMPRSVPWSGTLRVVSQDPTASPNADALPLAVLRVYALYATTDNSYTPVSAPSRATAIVQIAETRTLTDGSFQLELPDQFQL